MIITLMEKRTTKPVLADSVVQKSMYAFSLPTLHTSTYIAVLGKRNEQKCQIFCISYHHRKTFSISLCPIKKQYVLIIYCVTLRIDQWYFCSHYHSRNTVYQNNEPRQNSVYCLTYVYDTIHHIAVFTPEATVRNYIMVSIVIQLAS